MDRSWPGAGGRNASGRRAMTRGGLIAACVLSIAGCQPEKREIGAAPPASPPRGLADSRAADYEANRYEISEGGRMFRWFGCDGCHTDGSPGYLNLTDMVWRQGGSTAEIYRSMAAGAPGMPPYAGRVTPHQTWQVAAYLHWLHAQKPAQRRRSAGAQQGEPSGSTWGGPL